AYVFKVPLKGRILDPVGKGVTEIPVQVTGTDLDGGKYDVTTTTDKDGNFDQRVRPGNYTVKAKDPDDAVAPGSYTVSTVQGSKTAVDACAVSVDREAVTVNFLSECEQTVNFQTSMIAKGCLIRLDAKGKKFKAKGPVRVNGIDFAAEKEKDDPIEFDTQAK